MRPQFIWVGSHKYTVTYSTEELAIIGLRIKATLLGHTNHWALTITIQEGLPHTVERETLLHEVIHAIWSVSGIDDKIALEDQETMVRGVEQIFFQVLTNNSTFLKYLADKEK